MEIRSCFLISAIPTLLSQRYLETKISGSLVVVGVNVSEPTMKGFIIKDPTTAAFPNGSAAIAVGPSPPPIRYVAQRTFSFGSYVATNMGSMAPEVGSVSISLPKTAVSLRSPPVIKIFPSAVALMKSAPSLLFPCEDFAHNTFPFASYFATKTLKLLLTFASTMLLPKSIVGLRYCPVANALPLPSALTELPFSSWVPVALFAHSTFPFGSYLARKKSWFPLLVSVVVPKVAVRLVKSPDTNAFPDGSVLTESALSLALAVPTSLLAQSMFPFESYLATKIAEELGLVSTIEALKYSVSLLNSPVTNAPPA